MECNLSLISSMWQVITARVMMQLASTSISSLFDVLHFFLLFLYNQSLNNYVGLTKRKRSKFAITLKNLKVSYNFHFFHPQTPRRVLQLTSDVTMDIVSLVDGNVITILTVEMILTRNTVVSTA